MLQGKVQSRCYASPASYLPLTPPCLYVRVCYVRAAACRAIEAGQWVLLDSANLCNPTVLDRLNPLLEPQGAQGRQQQ